MLRHYDPIILIQIKHGIFTAKGTLLKRLKIVGDIRKVTFQAFLIYIHIHRPYPSIGFKIQTFHIGKE